MKKSFTAGLIGCTFVFLFMQPLAAQSPLVPGATLTTVYSSNVFFEGPTWDPVTQKLFFTTPDDSPHTVYRLNGPGQVSIWMSTSAAINGTFLANDGRLLAAVQDERAIISYRIGAGGPEDPRVLARDSSWNRPNDLCQTAAGDIYFTGPDWGGFYQAVYHLDTSGNVNVIITSMSKPNGISTSLDDSLLYVSDSDRGYWMVFPINPDGSVESGSVFFNPSTSDHRVPDGMTMDEEGNLYLTGRGGLWIVSPQGHQLDFIPISENSSNVTFGGAEGKTLYITCQNKVYSLENTIKGKAFTGNTGVQKGDVNGDDNITIVDALMTAQYYVGLNPFPFDADAADVSGCDGVITILDALVIAQYYVRKIAEFPCS